jgi:transposase-like protein
MNITDACFSDADKARVYLESLRWPGGPVCPHCGSQKATSLEGLKHRPGVYQCNEAECREQFTVTVGTVMERSKIPLNKWLYAIHEMGASKKGKSAHQMHRELGITYQSAWFMCHRIREAMRDDSPSMMGGGGKVVEADETYYGRSKQKHPLSRNRKPTYTKKGWKDKGSARPIVALVERGGSVRSFHIGHATQAQVEKIVTENVAKESRLHTDESRLYTRIGAEFAGHETVKHSAKEYVIYNHTFDENRKLHTEVITTNTIEGYFSIFKRGMKGVYQHCDEKHLHRYLSEFDFRYNSRTALGVTDTERAGRIVRGAEGKRLTYRRPDGTSL